MDNALKEHGNISAKDLDLIPIIDTPEEVVKVITDFYGNSANQLKPNYQL